MNVNTHTAIQARSLTKSFGDVQAVSGLDLEVSPGEAVGLLGPNGAGKSTTLSMLMGLRTPDAGAVHVFGHPAGSQKARALTGATPQSTGFPDQLSPREILEYTAARYGCTAQIEDLSERFGLHDLIDRRVAGFSGGEQRRVALALAFVGNPKLVFLDEPTAGLDIAAQDAFRIAARDFVAGGGALILTSHIWDEIEAVCDSITLIDQGKAVLNERIEDMRTRASGKLISFTLPDGTTPPDWMHANHDGLRWHVESNDAGNVLRRMVNDHLPFSNLTLEPMKLRDLIDRIHQKETLQ